MDICSAASLAGLDDWSSGWAWAGTSVKRCDAVERSRSVVEEVAPTVAVLPLVLDEGMILWWETE